MEIVISIGSLLISCFTLWATYWHKGQVEMTRPAIVIFAHEGKRKNEPKVFLRTLLRSTSKNGDVVESLFLILKHEKSVQTFSVWAYGDKGVVRGSGIFVSEQGIEVYHHFIVPKSVKNYVFLSGNYDVEVHAVIRGKKKKLCELKVTLPEEMTQVLNNGILGVYFDWDLENSTYTPCTEEITLANFVRLTT
jgi:hypothetical protein